MQREKGGAYEATTRYFGAYAARTRGACTHLKPQRPKVTPPKQLEHEPASKPSSSWARLIKKIYECDPLRCPKCDGTMRIIAFITKPQEIARLLQNLGLPPYRAPPPFKLPSNDDDPLFSTA